MCQFRIRTLLVLVTVVAVALGFFHYRLRGKRFQRLAQLHGGESLRCFFMAEMIEPSPCRLLELLQPDHPAAPDAQRVIDRWHECARHHRTLRVSYERAARYPWLAVVPALPAPAEPVGETERLIARWRSSTVVNQRAAALEY